MKMLKIPYDKHLLIHQVIHEIDYFLQSSIDSYRVGKNNEEIQALERVRRFLNREREELTGVAYRNYIRSKKVGRIL
jgi:hypothetical protein